MTESYEEPVLRSNYGTFRRESNRRRRHSSYHTNNTRPWTVDHDNIQVLVIRFYQLMLSCRTNFKIRLTGSSLNWDEDWTS